MGNVPLPGSEKTHTVNWTVVGILGLLVIVATSIVPLTLTIIQRSQSDALMIDLAGRQRMRLERHMKEILLALDGVNSAYLRTRRILQERLVVLIHGGTTAVRFDDAERVALPGAPTEEIREKFIEQDRLLDRLMVKTDRWLETPRNSVSYRMLRDEVSRDNAALLEVANDAVIMLAQHSNEQVGRLIRWEIVVVLLVVAVASLMTWRFIQSERALQRGQAITMEALRQRDAVKSSLLSSVSHELRTPLTAIKTMLFNLRQDAGTQPVQVRQEFLKNIEEELDYLDHLVGNLLDMSRIEAGTVNLVREWHLLDELMEAAIRRVGQRLERRPLRIDMTQDLRPIYVDGMEIQQVLVNLLDNAVKYSPDGSPISIRASVVDSAVEVEVANEGAGIPPGELEKIFDRFYRVSPGQARAVPGTGLGLAICKSIIEAHGGQIMARSHVGQETTIMFRLPLFHAVPVREQETAHA